MYTSTVPGGYRELCQRMFLVSTVNMPLVTWLFSGRITIGEESNGALLVE